MTWLPVAGLLLASLAGVPLAPSTVAETCHGLAATIVGTPQDNLLEGTAGPDVIVTSGATAVLSRAGDDTICVTGTDPGYDDYVYVNAGEGDDQVDGSADAHETRVELESGSDTFAGGPSVDTVLAAESGPETHDILATGAGDDSVFVDNDQVDLGDGDDTVTMDASRGPGALVAGGDGADTLKVDGLDGSGWVVDNHAGSGRRAGRHWADWSGLEAFDLDGSGSVRFIGSAADEHVEVWTDTSAGAAMAGGDDTIVVVSTHLALGASLTGGAGRDVLDASPYRTRASVQGIELDLGRNRLRFTYSSEVRTTAWLRGFEDVHASGPHLRVAGDTGPNRLVVSSCNVVVSGEAGDDVIDWRQEHRRCGRADRPSPRIVLYGNHGQDMLIGGEFADVLVGGLGNDQADGKGGRDRCAAETEKSCELTLP